jgi:hypothetical protein
MKKTVKIRWVQTTPLIEKKDPAGSSWWSGGQGEYRAYVRGVLLVDACRDNLRKRVERMGYIIK